MICRTCDKRSTILGEFNYIANIDNGASVNDILPVHMMILPSSFHGKLLV